MKILKIFHKFQRPPDYCTTTPWRDNEWVKITKNYENVKTIIDDQSTCWIMASEFLISCNCYTSLEAYLLNKILINHSPIKENIHDFELIKSVQINTRKIR